MNLTLSISTATLRNLFSWVTKIPTVHWVVITAFILAYCSTIYSLSHHIILAYGDAQSHINISKRVVDSITPGMAQLGGVWLPLPHLLMIPFVKFEFLYRTGLAGSIVSGLAFIVSSVFIYKLIFFLTKNNLVAFTGFLVFATNPNILYLQTTPMTEPTLITFFILSSYFFVKFIFEVLHSREASLDGKGAEYINLVYAAFFALCASLSRYDGWFLVAVELGVVGLLYLPLAHYLEVLKVKKLAAPFIILKNKLFLNKRSFNKLEGMMILFATLAFTGIIAWFIWCWLILGDPLYFADSIYSAGSQQLAFKARGQLPAYHNLPVAFEYYFFDSMTNVGIITFAVAIIGLIIYLSKNKKLSAYLFALILMVPFIFNVLTLFLGQSIIFIPHIVTPDNFEWKLFNARYGILMAPAAAVFFALLFYYVNFNKKLLLGFLILLQIGLYMVGYSKVITLSDGVEGLSASHTTDADNWMKQNYHGGLIVMDDFARSLNIIEDNLPMQNIIYVGNKPYWDDSMKAPEKYATWVVIQKDDAVWNNIWTNPETQGRLYKYFNKVYTSPNVLIFKRMSDG